MDNAQLARASFEDIVFEGRNKAYGAYVLRKLYSKHVTRAFLVAMIFFALMIGGPLLARMLTPKEDTSKPKLDTEVVLEAPPLDKTEPPPPPPPPSAPPPPPPKLSTVKFTPPVIKKDEEVKKIEEIPDQEELEDKVVATKTVEGNTNNLAVDLSGLGDEGNKVVEEVVEAKVYTYVEQMPQPPGGMEGLMQYLGKNIKYPALALRNQVEGKVFVNFVVGPSGQITDVKVTKGIGAGCDEEAVRVISKMPAWSPGKQNGRAVSVSYTVPVTFTIK
ncbi:energy transducer TonB [Hymenobacter gummosus]|uniref:Energy transducer TonB n=2 Tax=Hymenobacter gummosus TaxID=1776032 RepID=A0A431U9C5_9BACT|nr:energy transducer TonB [Hymenobacter gummosus]